MIRKIFFIFLFSIFSLLSFSEADNTTEEEITDVFGRSDYSLGFLEENTIYLTPEEVTELALKNNFDIQLARFDAQFKGTDLDKVESIYDTIVEAEVTYKDDRTKNVSALAGTESETRNYNVGISKKLPTGTTVELDFDNERSWTNSSYVTTNPAYESSATLTLKQDLGRDFFGLIGRSDVKITKIDIENAHYTSSDKIEKMLADVQKTYWKIAQQLSIVGLRYNMLLQADELFQINREKIQRGVIEKPQLLSSEANLRQREVDLIVARNELESYINELKLLLNLENNDAIVLPKENLDLAAQFCELNKALKIAFSHRRDYLRAKNEVEAKKIKLVMNHNNLWPEINLEASVERNGLEDHFSEAIQEINSEDNPEYFLRLKIKFPLENREAKSEFNKAKIENASALVNLKKTECQILVQIKDSVRNCNILEGRARKQKEINVLQEEKLAAELKHYRYGRSDTDTIIRYQNDLLVSELLYAQALLDYKEALIELSLKENSLLDHFWKDTL